MSESDSASSSGAALGGDAQILVTASQEATATNDGWANWAAAESESSSAASGLDMVSGDHDAGDWFPSAPIAGTIAAVLSGSNDGDPLVELPPSDFAQVAENLDDADVAHLRAESASQDIPLTLDALYHPIDHSVPLDHVDWHLGGLLS